jgi:hypothetical protein
MATRRKSTPRRPDRVLDARPDTIDFRDRMYEPTLVEVPTHRPLEEYLAHRVPILDQGQEGACTGFGLATVANYLLTIRRVLPDPTPVSPRMIYEMARRYDEWPGEDYSGSSARGAMKGWHKHGVCSEGAWPWLLEPGGRRAATDGLHGERAGDALKRPLGAYYRVNHKDLVAMHAAIAEVGILYATAFVHAGWDAPDADGLIPHSDRKTGAHAFALVAYDEHGFWLQNSWGPGWGRGGFACISYDDWLEHGSDVWVARLGAPIVLRRSAATAVAHSAGAGQSVAYAYPDLRPHIVSIGNNGRLKPGGDYGTSAEDIATLFRRDLPAAIADGGVRHLLLYAHGGLVDARSAVQRLADYRSAMLGAGVYPLSFIWHTDYWTTLKNILADALRRRRPEGPLDAAKDFMLDRLDDALEPLARGLSGKAAWDEMKRNALAASEAADGGARLTARRVAALLRQHPALKVHLVGHSAGSIFHAPLVTLLARAGVPIATTTLWAPAITVELFKKHYVPAVESGAIGRLALFVLKDQVEQDDHCANIYHKSLLYLVSNAFEAKARIPLFRDGVPILGMEKFLARDEALLQLIRSRRIELVLTPNAELEGAATASTARHHGDFDDDLPTVKATLRRIVGDGEVDPEHGMEFQRSAGSLREQRVLAQLA